MVVCDLLFYFNCLNSNSYCSIFSFVCCWSLFVLLSVFWVMVAVCLFFELWLLFVCLLSYGCCLSVFWVMVAVCLSFELWLLFVCLLSYGCCLSVFWIMVAVCLSFELWLLFVCLLSYGCCLSVFWVMVVVCLSFELWLLFVLCFSCSQRIIMLFNLLTELYLIKVIPESRLLHMLNYISMFLFKKRWWIWKKKEQSES